jgi:hypothetical protein
MIVACYNRVCVNLPNFAPIIVAALFTVVGVISAYFVTPMPSSRITWIAIVLDCAVAFVLITRLQQQATDERTNAHNARVETQLSDLRQLISQAISVREAGVTAPTIPASPQATLMDRVFPLLRFAYILQNYDGATADRVENENRILVPSSPAVHLNYERYVKEFDEDRSWFDFGVANLNAWTVIDDVTLIVTFVDNVIVNLTPSGTHWAGYSERPAVPVRVPHDQGAIGI